MRNQYKLLAEKYQNIQENDKEDIMAGLENLEKDQIITKKFQEAISAEEIVEIAAEYYSDLSNITEREESSVGQILYDLSVDLYLAVAWAVIYLDRIKFKEWKKINHRPMDPELNERIDSSFQEIKHYYNFYLRNKTDKDVV
jgi:hypothetical protein